MADPVTATLAVIAIVGTVAGGVQQYQTAKAQGKAQEDWEQYNASVAEKEAQAASQKAVFEASRARDEARQLRGRQMVMLAKSGVMPGEGSPLLLMAESAGNEELDIMMIEREGLITSMQKENEAAAHRAMGKQLNSFGRAKANASLLSSFTQAASIGASASASGAFKGKPKGGGGSSSGGGSGSSGGGGK